MVILELYVIEPSGTFFPDEPEKIWAIRRYDDARMTKIRGIVFFEDLSKPQTALTPGPSPKGRGEFCLDLLELFSAFGRMP